MAGNDGNVESQKGNKDSVAYESTNVSSEWQVDGNNLTNSSIRMIPINSTMMESVSCSPMVDSFSMPIWDPSLHEAGTSSNIGVRTCMDWSASNSMLRGPMFLPSVQGMVPQNMPHFPADSGFIERAARYSCFSGGNFGEAMNPFSGLNPYSHGLGPIQGPHDVLGGGGSKSLETNMTSVSKEASLHRASGNEGSPYKNEKKIESYVNSHDEVKHGANTSGNESNEAEFSGRGGQEESSCKATSTKKRKRTGKDNNEHNEINKSPKPSMEKAKDTTEVKQKDDQNTTLINTGGKNGKEGSQGSDAPKEEYIHMRARRGQATNSHSLAERVRREKISERMKFLQDLVPGCSKVTGKAVMLDEIINYVQSLQQQVEFLSMKLATVNPRQLDVNIESLLAKDGVLAFSTTIDKNSMGIMQFQPINVDGQSRGILLTRGGLSSSLPFNPHDMTTIPFPPPHPSQPGLMQVGLPSLGNSSEALRRLMNFQPGGGFKDHASHVQSAWEDELHNIVHMGLNSNAAFSSQDLSDSLQPRHSKEEP